MRKSIAVIQRELGLPPNRRPRLVNKAPISFRFGRRDEARAEFVTLCERRGISVGSTVTLLSGVSMRVQKIERHDIFLEGQPRPYGVMAFKEIETN